MPALPYGDAAARLVSQRIAAAQANLAALAVYDKTNGAVDGMVGLDISTGKVWRFNASSTLTADNQTVAGAGSGRWLLTPGKYVFSLPIAFGTVDTAILWTLPTGVVIQPEEFYWGVTSSFTGGSSSAIGVSSSTKSGYTTQGDLLGGATGDVLATLAAAATPIMGTIGAGFDTLAKRRKLLTATDTIRFDRITSAFTAGVGTVNMVGTLLVNPGA